MPAPLERPLPLLLPSAACAAAAMRIFSANARSRASAAYTASTEALRARRLGVCTLPIRSERGTDPGWHTDGEHLHAALTAPVLNSQQRLPGHLRGDTRWHPPWTPVLLSRGGGQAPSSAEQCRVRRRRRQGGTSACRTAPRPWRAQHPGRDAPLPAAAPAAPPPPAGAPRGSVHPRWSTSGQVMEPHPGRAGGCSAKDSIHLPGCA